MDAIVNLEGVTKVYRDFWGRTKVAAVQNLSFAVHKGEVFGLLGPNGSGKTTTLKLLLGLVFPSQGKVWMLGREPGDVTVKKQVGFLPEESYLYPFLTAEQSLAFYAGLFGMTRDTRRARIAELIKLVGLETAANRPVREFSKGMARRLGLAQSLINRPELLLLDEPTSGLDPMGCHEVKELIRTLRDQGTTIILCSHLLADVEDVCDRIAILNRGQLQVSGRMEDLLIMKDHVQVIFKGVTGEPVAAFIRGQGGEVISCTEERSRLEDLFVRTVRRPQAKGPVA